MPAFTRFTLIISYVPVRADLQACHVCCSALLGSFFVYVAAVANFDNNDN